MMKRSILKKMKTRSSVMILMLIIIIFMILPYVCHMDNPTHKVDYCRGSIASLNSISTQEDKDNTVSSIKPVAVLEAKNNQKYNFQRELELDKKERFERKKEDLLYKLARRKAHVFDKSIDINEPIPFVADEIAKVQSYYNISERKLTVLNANYLIESKRLCSEIPVVIVLVPSIPTNVDIRVAIRTTYGLIAHYTPSDLLHLGMEHTVKIAFLLGRGPNQSVEIGVRKEQEKYQDIVQIDFIDSYYNLTFKILYGLKWVNTNCGGVKYVVKADEDVFVNIKLLLAELKTFRVSHRGSVFGFIHSTPFGLRVLKSGKWGVSEAEYPLRRYPPYAQGTSYTLTGNLVPKIVETAQRLPYLHIEDAFITGIVAGSILGANLERLIGNSYWTEEEPDPCEFVRTERISQSNMKPSLMYKTWQALVSPESVCGNRMYNSRAHRSNMKMTYKQVL